MKDFCPSLGKTMANNTTLDCGKDTYGQKGIYHPYDSYPIVVGHFVKMTDKTKALIGPGILLLMVGVFFFLTLYLMVLGFIFLFIGGLLIVFIDSKWFIKLLIIGLPYGFVGLTIFNAYAQPETFLISENFKGAIYIVHDDSLGADKEFEGIRRIYRVPKTGVLFTQFPVTKGILNQEFYYISADGKRTRLGELDAREFNDTWTINPRPTEPVRDSLAVFNQGTTGQVTIQTDNNKQLDYRAFNVGTYNEIRTGFDFIYETTIDSLRKAMSGENALQQRL